MAGMHVESEMTQAHGFPCPHKHTQRQMHVCMNCSGEAVQYSIIKSAVFKELKLRSCTFIYLRNQGHPVASEINHR